MCGIYIFTNKIDKKSYIGQSVDIKRRYNEHLNVSFKDSRDYNTHFHRALRKYGIENFTFFILEECDRSELDILEYKYIKLYNTEDPKFGYNKKWSKNSGNFAPVGENHGMSKLTADDINIIFEMLKSDVPIKQIAEKFSITSGQVRNINSGVSWADSSKEYPIQKLSLSRPCEANGMAKFTKDEVYKIRKRYDSGESVPRIYQDYKQMCSVETIRNICKRKTWKNI